jgi:AbrB family looped-hinge helix DNA binding protein
VVVIPASLRRRFGLDEGSFVIAEEAGEGILIRPARVTPVEIYSPKKKASFLLSTTLDAADYAAARREVTGLGLDPDRVPHSRPSR